MPQIAQGRVRFGSFELDPRAGELYGNGERTVLQEQQLKVLLMLIERAGEIATREEIKKRLWPNDTIVEFDNGINSTIKKLRGCLGDTAENPRYIETIARRGYRLMVPVEWVGAEDTFAEVSSRARAPGVGEGVEGPSVDSDALPTAKLAVGRLTGKVVSHYRVLEVIGGGGMGLVYRAEDLKLGRAVALKFLPEEVGDDAKARERFEREAHAVSALSHPNICPIYEFAEHDGQPFIVMELLQGRTLREHLADGRSRLTQPEGLEIAIQIASGLEAAHEKGIIHRDIKPANIFITERDVAKILDFGVAKVLQLSENPHPANTGPDGAPGEKGRGFSPAAAASAQDERGNQSPAGLIPPQSSEAEAFGAPEGAPLQTPGLKPESEEDAQRRAEARLFHPKESSLTRTGAKLGTAGYMSPEQVRGEALDARTDIFSFGLVLYEMATGQRAFTGDTAAVVRDGILNNSPAPLRELNSTLPARLVTTIDKCLEKKRERRYQSAAELRRALEDVKRGAENKVPRRFLAALAAGVLVLAALAVGLYIRRASHAPRPGSSSSSLQVRLLTESGKAYRAAGTPDGHYVAYVKRDAGKYELRLLQVAGERDVQLLPGSPQPILSLHFSPDGNFLYFLRVLDPAKDPDASGVFRISTLGGRVTSLATDALPNSITVSPDGKQVGYIAGTPSKSLIVAVDSDGGNRHVLAERPRVLQFNFVEWSPSQNTLAAVAIGKEDNGLVRVDLPSGSITDLSVSGWGTVGQPAWSTDGATILAPAAPSESSIVQIWAFDPQTGIHRTLTSRSTSYSPDSLSATATGDLIANTVTQETTIWTTDHTSLPHLVPALRGEGSADVVWVDKRIVTSNIAAMMVHDPASDNPTKLRSSNSSIYLHLGRCGPGQVVYWAYNATQLSHIARTDITSGVTSALTEGPSGDEPACTADGSSVIFRQCTAQGPRCSFVRKSLDSGHSTVFHEFDPIHEQSKSPIPSPDGTTVLFWRQPDGADPHEWATLIPLEGGALTTLKLPIPVGEVVAFKWSADGKAILVARNENGVGNIWSLSLDGKVSKKLTSFDSENIFAFDVSSDNRLVISRGNWISDVVLIKNVKE